MFAGVARAWHWFIQVREVRLPDSSGNGAALLLPCVASAAILINCPPATGCRFTGNKSPAHASYESGAHTPIKAKFSNLITIL